MDLDYRALSNAGLWSLGRLQTYADCERVLDGIALADTEGCSTTELAETLKKLAPRWFVMRNAHARSGPILVQPRTTLSLLRGPMTRAEIRAAVEWRRGVQPQGAAGCMDERVAPYGGTRYAWGMARPKVTPTAASLPEALRPLVDQLAMLSQEDRERVISAARVANATKHAYPKMAWASLMAANGVVSFGGNALEDCDALYDD